MEESNCNMNEMGQLELLAKNVSRDFTHLLNRSVSDEFKFVQYNTCYPNRR